MEMINYHNIPSTQHSTRKLSAAKPLRDSRIALKLSDNQRRVIKRVDSTRYREAYRQRSNPLLNAEYMFDHKFHLDRPINVKQIRNHGAMFARRTFPEEFREMANPLARACEDK